MGRLRRRQELQREKARWHGGPTVLAFLFAPPDSDAIRILDARGEYFDVRTGNTWDLFFPGYYRSRAGKDQDYEFEDIARRDFERQGRRDFERHVRRVGRDYARTWYFSAADFDGLRRHIELSSERRWEYSGGTDLVLISAWLVDQGEPTVDWASTISGQLTDQEAGTKTLTLANVIERITRDIETRAEDASYGVSEVTDGPLLPESHNIRDFMINALGGVAAALGVKALGA